MSFSRRVHEVSMSFINSFIVFYTAFISTFVDTCSFALSLSLARNYSIGSSLASSPLPSLLPLEQLSTQGREIKSRLGARVRLACFSVHMWKQQVRFGILPSRNAACDNSRAKQCNDDSCSRQRHNRFSLPLSLSVYAGCESR